MTDLDDVTEDGVQFSMSEAVENKLHPAFNTRDILTGALQLCDHLPHLQHNTVHSSLTTHMVTADITQHRMDAMTDPLTPTVAIWVQPSFVIFDIRAL